MSLKNGTNLMLLYNIFFNSVIGFKDLAVELKKGDKPVLYSGAVWMENGSQFVDAVKQVVPEFLTCLF